VSAWLRHRAGERVAAAIDDRVAAADLRMARAGCSAIVGLAQGGAQAGQRDGGADRRHDLRGADDRGAGQRRASTLMPMT